MSKFFYHGTRNIYNILKILISSGIVCQRILGFNGLNYISLCNKAKDEEYVSYPNAFYNYIRNSYCLIISDEVDAIKPQKLNIDCFKSNTELQEYLTKHSNIRYSDMFDEYQVRDFIPLKYILGVGLPIRKIKSEARTYENDSLFQSIKCILNLIEVLNLDIIDTSVFGFIEEYESAKSNNKDIKYKLKKLLQKDYN